MHLLLHASLALAVSAVHIPLHHRAENECVPENESDDDDGYTTQNAISEPAGIGAEFETVDMLFVATDDCTLPQINALKGHIVAERAGDNWKLTADTSSGKLDAEYILDGVKIKVGADDAAAAAGKAAADDFIAWDWRGGPGPPYLVDIEDNKCAPFAISLPGPVSGFDPSSASWSPQITAAMPLEGIYSLMKEQQQRVRLDVEPASPNILSDFGAFDEYLIVVEQDYFQSRPNGIDSTQVSDDVLAFCSMVLSYMKPAAEGETGGAGRSLKLFTSFMPRTEFNTLYQQVKSKMPGNLFTIFNYLACYKTDIINIKNTDGTNGKAFNIVLDTEFCSGSVSNPTPNGVFRSLSYRNSAGTTLNAKNWIDGIGAGTPFPDLLTQFDQANDGSIGKLQDKLELMYNTQRSVPIFEFRDLKEAKTSEFETFMSTADLTVQKMHQQFANPPQRKRKRQDASACVNPSASTSAPAATFSCTYQDATPENPAECTCTTGSSTTIVAPMTMSSVSVITQSCDFTTWPSSQPSVTQPPQTVSTNYAGCQVCTILAPNDADCSPLPSSVGCVPKSTTTVLSGATSGISVGTLTGTALFSAITSAIDQVCEIPTAGGGPPGTYTCTETATATVASNIKYTNYEAGSHYWEDDGVLTLQITEANYDSLEWYDDSKAVIGIFAQNSTQNNCNVTTAFQRQSLDGILGKRETPEPADDVSITDTVCKAGSHYQLIVIDPTGAPRELAFELGFHAGVDGTFFCQFLEHVIEFVELELNYVSGTEAAIPRELAVDEKLLELCEGGTPSAINLP